MPSPHGTRDESRERHPTSLPYLHCPPTFKTMTCLDTTNARSMASGVSGKVPRPLASSSGTRPPCLLGRFGVPGSGIGDFRGAVFKPLAERWEGHGGR